MSDPWIEFLDDPEPTPAEPGPPPPRRGSRALVLAGIAALGLVVLVATRAVNSDSTPPQRAQSLAATEAAQPSPWVMYVPDGRPCADGTLAECDGADVAIRDAVTEHLRLTVVAQTTDYDADAGIVERHIEADNGRGTHLIVEIHRSGAGGGRQAISAGPGAAVVTAEVGSGGYTVQLVAVGPKADVPSRAALAALGNDPRLLAA